MDKPKQLFTYAVAVFESLWPRITDLQGDESPKLVGPTGAKSAFKYSGNQNQFTGYFKLIPLNILQVDATSTKQGHQWKLLMDASLMYVEADPKSISPALAEYLRANTLQVPDQTTNFLVGIMEGYSRDAFSSMNDHLDRYVLPGELFSQLVSEMDTCTIFMVNELGEFAEEEIIKLNGGSFSRLNELDLTERGRKLAGLGIVPSMEEVDPNNFNQAVALMRSFISNADLYINTGTAGGTAYRYYDSYLDMEEQKNQFKRDELAAVAKFDSTITVAGYDDPESLAEAQEAALSQTMGPIVAAKYLPNLEKRAMHDDRTTTVAVNLANQIENYYESNRLSNIVSFSIYESIGLQLLEHLPDATIDADTLDRVGTRSFSELQKMIIAGIVLDIVSASVAPNEYARLRTDPITDPILETIIASINARYELTDTQMVTVEDYKIGTIVFAGRVNGILEDIKAEREDLVIYEPDNVTSTGVIQRSIDEQATEGLKVPLSAHTPGMVLKGHITGIETMSAVSQESYDKTITVTGNGLELPLKRHSVFYDQTNREKKLFFNFMRFGISNSSPIEAALDIMETFAPDYVKTREADTQDIDDQIESGRNAGVYRDKGGTVIEHGTVIYPEANSEAEQALLATPIHYINNSYLRAIKDIFDEISLSEFIKNQLLRDIQQTNLFNVLGSILGQGSAYTWFVDEFGFIKVRYENAAAVTPMPTALSPIIDDDKIMSVTTATSEENIYTMVEVVPHSISVSAPSEGKLAGLFGRSTPPTIEDYYALYTVKSLDIEEAQEEVAQLLKQALITFNEATLEALDRYQFEAGVRITAPPSVFNDVDYESVRVNVIPDVYANVVSTPLAEPEEVQYGVQPSTVEELKSRISSTYLPRLDGSRPEARFTDDFLEKVVEVSDRLGIRPEWLLAIMGAETAGTFDPAIPNGNYTENDPYNNTAVGLIQFIAATAANLIGGIAYANRLDAREIMMSMDQSTQLLYVEKYLKPFKGRMNGLADVYLAIFTGGIPEGDILYTYPSDEYIANDHLDVDGDQAISKNELAASGWGWYNNLFGDRAVEPLPISVTEEPTTDVEVPEIDKEAALYNPKELRNLFETVGDIVQSSLYNALQSDDFTNLTARTPTDVMIFDLNNSYFKDFYYTNEENERVTSLYNYVARKVEETITSLKLPKIGNLTGLTFKGQGYLIRLLSTLVVVGANPDNIESLLTASSNEGKLVQFILKHARLYVNPEELNQFPASALVINATKGRALPYQNYDLQETRPEAISADLFRYGLRIYRLDDYYMATINFTKFRAEAIRKLHEEPIRGANVSMIGNPMYKVGNTALVVTREIEERKYNYIHQGTLKTLNDLGDIRNSLIFKMDDSIEDGLQPKVYTPFTEDLEATPEGILQHFKDSYEFILSEYPFPVPISAYVPLYGIYTSENNNVIKYLKLLVQVATQEYEDDYRAIEEELQDTVIDIVTSVYGLDYTLEHVNTVVNILAPQYYHAYHYYIEQVQNSWQYGGNYKTNLRLNYGMPASVCHIPVSSKDFSKFHVIGYVLNKSPYMLYNDRGKKGEVITMEHPLFNFTLRQQEEEWTFYKSSERYRVALVLDKIRKKILYPDLYSNGGVV